MASHVWTLTRVWFFAVVNFRVLTTGVGKHHGGALVLRAESSDHGAAGASRMTILTVPQSRTISQAYTLRERFPSLKPRFCLILFLAFAFFLFCPLWGYFSFCGIDASHDASQNCFLYNFVFNMPLWLPTPAILLVTLVFLPSNPIAPYSPVFGAPLYRISARAPPLS
jgi:hypothetical protein